MKPGKIRKDHPQDDRARSLLAKIQNLDATLFQLITTARGRGSTASTTLPSDEETLRGDAVSNLNASIDGLELAVGAADE